jgi:hypothetical protein
MWLAFGINHLDGNLEPTLQALEKMKLDALKINSENYDKSFEKQEQTKYFLNASDSNRWVYPLILI